MAKVREFTYVLSIVFGFIALIFVAGVVLSNHERSVALDKETTENCVQVYDAIQKVAVPLFSLRPTPEQAERYRRFHVVLNRERQNCFD